MDNSAVDAYLERIGAERPERTDHRALTLLQERHLDAVPFENLSIHLGEPIVLEADALVDKIVRRHRGGFCYELNGAFATLLQALDFRVTLMAARVYGDDAELGPPYDHLALRVDLDEPWLVDVGFGAFSRRPLRLGARSEQQDPAGRFHLVDVDHGDLTVLMDGKPAYLLDLRPRQLVDFEATCWWQQTSTASHFATSLTCSLPTPTGRITLSGNRLIRTHEGSRTETLLATDSDVLDAYKRNFGIRLDRLPVDPRDATTRAWHADDVAQGDAAYVEVLGNRTMSVGVYTLPAGGEDRQQPHSEDEVYVVLAGRAVLRLAVDSIPVTAGSVVFVPARAEHRFVEITDELRVAVVFAPAEGSGADR